MGAAATNRKPGDYITAKNRTTCNRCGQRDLAWYRTKAGKWLLCNTAPSQDHRKAVRDVRYIAPWAPHRCGDRQDRHAAVETEQERQDRARNMLDFIEDYLGKDPADATRDEYRAAKEAWANQ